MKIKKTLPLFLIMLVTFIDISCERDKDEESYFIGKWTIQKAEPPIDEIYYQSYIYIKKDWSFEFYDSSRDQLIAGLPEHLSMKGNNLILTDPLTGEKLLFVIVSLRQEALILRTSVFNDETLLYLNKVFS